MDPIWDWLGSYGTIVLGVIIALAATGVALYFILGKEDDDEDADDAPDDGAAPAEAGNFAVRALGKLGWVGGLIKGIATINDLTYQQETQGLSRKAALRYLIDAKDMIQITRFILPLLVLTVFFNEAIEKPEAYGILLFIASWAAYVFAVVLWILHGILRGGGKIFWVVGCILILQFAHGFAWLVLEPFHLEHPYASWTLFLVYCALLGMSVNYHWKARSTSAN